MQADNRLDSAKYYDLSPKFPADLPFYQRMVSESSSLLELGCGTGRILIPLSQNCRFIHGIERSEAMIGICMKKLAAAKIPTTKARVELGNVTDFRLQRHFDLIIAPFRVLQNLESDAEVQGLFDCIRAHLSPAGSCILNAFRPYAEAEVVKLYWETSGEKIEWEVRHENGKVVCSSKAEKIDKEKLVLFPEMIYRTYRGNEMIDEARMNIVMRCYYPDQLINLVQENGFTITQKWGGYHDEKYGEGPELVIQFKIGVL